MRVVIAGSGSPLGDATAAALRASGHEAIEIGPDVRVVLVEGNYLLHDRDGWERVRPLLDEVLFLAPDDAVRRERLIARHVAYGKTPEDAEAWVARSDDPNAALVAATAGRADRILRAT